MNPINITFFHEALGKLRTIYTDGDLLFSICDVSRILGYRDEGKTIRRYCYQVNKHEFGSQTLCFMGAADIDTLFRRTKSTHADELHKWICDIIIPEVLEKQDEYEENDLSDENELLLIHRCDYDRLTYAMAMACHHLVKFCEQADVLPLNSKTVDLRKQASESRIVCENLLKSHGITIADISEFDPEKVFSILDEDVISPEEGGYIGLDQVIEAFGQEAADYLTDWRFSNG